MKQDPTCSRTTLARYAGVVLLAALGSSNIAQAEPLASCTIRQLPPAADRTMTANAAIFSTSIVDDPLEDYRPHVAQLPPPSSDAGGEAPAPPLRLLLRGPHSERLIELQILLDDVDYRAVRKQWIEEVVANAKKKENPAADEVDPPADATATAQTASPLEEDEGEEPTVAARRRQTPTLKGRVLTYLAAVGSEASAEDLASEIEWLLNRWAEGPAVTVLSAGRSWERYGVAPLWTLIDNNSDGALDSNEIASAGERLKKSDVDESGVIEIREIEWRSVGQGGPVAATRAPLIEILEPSATEESPKESSQRAADLILRVNFQSNQSEPGRVELLAATDEATTTESENLLTLQFAPEYLEVSALAIGSGSRMGASIEAAQASPDQPETATPSTSAIPFNAASADQPEQLSIGAVADGYPLWRLVDTDGDRRLTAREQRELPALLKRLDANGDGQVAAEEQPLAIRLAVGRGPIIHRVLGKPSPAAIYAQPKASIAAPDWFLSMDRNGDGELARDEFAGTKEQFAALDSDSNGLLSPLEAGGESK